MTNTSVCLTEGNKDPTDFIFRFEDEAKPEASKTNGTKSKSSAKPDKSAPASSSKVTGVVVGSKVLRGKTRQQLADPDTAKTIAAKIALHQKELHVSRQEEGIKRFAGEDGGAGQDNGKTWKRFTAYKGEAGLPKESELHRVGILPFCFTSGVLLMFCFVDLRRQTKPERRLPYQRVCCAIPYQHPQKRCQQRGRRVHPTTYQLPGRWKHIGQERRFRT